MPSSSPGGCVCSGWSRPVPNRSARASPSKPSPAVPPMPRASRASALPLVVSLAFAGASGGAARAAARRAGARTYGGMNMIDAIDDVGVGALRWGLLSGVARLSAAWHGGDGAALNLAGHDVVSRSVDRLEAARELCLGGGGARRRWACRTTDRRRLAGVCNNSASAVARRLGSRAPGAGAGGPGVRDKACERATAATLATSHGP